MVSILSTVSGPPWLSLLLRVESSLEMFLSLLWMLACSPVEVASETRKIIIISASLVEYNISLTSRYQIFMVKKYLSSNIILSFSR